MRKSLIWLALFSCSDSVSSVICCGQLLEFDESKLAAAASAKDDSGDLISSDSCKKDE